MLRRLILLRHGHAEEHADDYQRPLSVAGRRGARRAGAEIEQSGILPSRILSSSAVRTLETAQLVAEACRFRGSIEAERALYLATDEQCKRRLQTLGDDVQIVLLVGHNPGLSELARELGYRGSGLAPAERATLDLEIESWSEL